MDSKPLILALVGPTASGKTLLAIDLAHQIDAEIISADSRQIFKYLTIGTAKPTSDQQRFVKHHFIDILEPDQEYNAWQFGKDARDFIEALITQNRIPLVVGGSGLYLKALIDGLFEGPGKDPDLRATLEQQLEEEGVEGLFAQLQRIDPAAAAGMKEIKSRQVIRALEVFFSTGKPISQFHAEQRSTFRYDFLQVALSWERKILYDRINRRVDAMIEEGFLAEVADLLNRGYGKILNALNTVGYKELIDHLEGNSTLDEAIDTIKRNTRRFAKRQLTWFRADPRIHWLNAGGGDEIRMLIPHIIKLMDAHRAKHSP